jgi:hypothetical protein
MTHLRAPRALYGCSCERRGTSALGAFGSLGDAVTLPADAAATASAGVAQAAASIPAFADAVKHLQAELNRFGPQAPVGLQYVTPLLAVNGLLDVNTAARAVQVLQRRYTDSIAAFPGESGASLDKLKQVTGQTAMLNPIGFVMLGAATGNVPANQVGVEATTGLIQKYGDSKGLPAAARSIIDTLTSNPNVLIVAGLAAVAAFYLWRR